MFFGPFGVAVTSLGNVEEGGGGGGGAGVGAFHAFVRFLLVWICRFPLPLGVWEGLRFVIVALPGLYSYLFFMWSYGKPVSAIRIIWLRSRLRCIATS